MQSSITRFSDRVEDYVNYRPGYPEQIIKILEGKTGLNNNSTIADIGSGTGISSEIFLKNGNKVFAVEPNKKMRRSAELFYHKDSNFTSINGRAEETNLQEHSIDIIFCGQAFHWFNNHETKIEFKRILKPHGHIVLVWNERQENDDFQKEYESLLKKIPEYNVVTHRNISDSDIITFFAPEKMYKRSIQNFQLFDLNGLKGRLQSSSYCPKQGLEHKNLMREIEALFYRFENDGLVKFEYETKIYWD